MILLSRILRFCTSLPFLCLALLATTVWFTASLYYRARAASERAVPASALQPKPVPMGVLKEVGGKAVELAVPPPTPAEAPKEIPPEVRKTLLAIPARLTLYTATPSAEPAHASASVSSRYLPFGTLIPCKLVNTIDSNADGTPVVAVVLEDMCNINEDGLSEVVIPAGTLAVLESTSPGRERDRIGADGTWVFVWRTRDVNNGLELPVPARALSRSFDATTGLYGHEDGRAGLRGVVIEDLAARRLDTAAHAAIQGGLAAAKQYDVSSNSLTGQVIRNPLPTLRNALTSGAEAYVQQYAAQHRQQAERESAFLRISAGTEFYIFPRATIDVRNARRASTALSNAARTAKN